MLYNRFLKDLGNKLKRQRKKLGLTQSELVEEINKGLSKNDDDYLSDKQLSRVECGECSTRLDKFVKWTLALGKTPDYFLLGIDNGDETKEGKIMQIYECLLNCSNEQLDVILSLVQTLNEKKK